MNCPKSKRQRIKVLKGQGQQVAPNNPPLVQLKGISKSFGPVTANQDIDLSIHAGQILALLGENGAGKSTLMSILAGHFSPDQGTILINGQTIRFRSPKQALQAGIGMVYQHFKLISGLSVAENIILGQIKEFFFSKRVIHNQVKSLCSRFGLEIDPRTKVSELSMGEKQRVEILKLLFRNSQVLIFDEPTSVLTPKESKQLFNSMRQMAAKGKAVVFISHKLEEVLAVADQVAILRKGKIIDQLPIGKQTSGRDLAKRMVGREIFLKPNKQSRPPGPSVLEINNLYTAKLQGIDLKVRQGEILALVGVAGNGQKDLVETVCGLTPPKQGTIKILDQDWKDFFQDYPWKNGLAYIPEDRLGMATCPNFSLLDNFLLTTRQGFCQGPWLGKKASKSCLQKLISKFNVQPPRLNQRAGDLSGGNLQKMVLARELFREPRLIVAEQPSQGLDIAATEEIWNYLLRSRDKAGILLVTGDLKEALTLADTIAVIFQGQIMDCFPASNPKKRDTIGPLMAGLHD